MRRHVVLGLLALLIFAGSVFAASVTVPFGETATVHLELNKGTSELLSVSVVDIPDDNVSQMYAEYSSSLRDRVFCAPSVVSVSSSSADFTCVITPGEPVDGYLTFVALDQNGNVYSSATRLQLTVTYKEQWFSAKTVARVGSDISVGGYTVTVKRASFLYVVLQVDGSPVTAFVNDETKLADDLYVVYKGYDPDTREVFLEFRSHVPISVSVSEKSYYLVAPRTVYREDNAVSIDVYTNCSAVEYRVKGSEKWESVSVSSGKATIELESNVDRIYVRCADDANLTQPVYIKSPKVIVRELNEDQIREKCVSLGFITRDQCPKQDCASYCVANGYVKPPAGYECKFVKPGEGDYRLLLGIAIIVAVVILAYLYRKGKIRLPEFGKKKDVYEAPQPAVEEAHDIQ